MSFLSSTRIIEFYIGDTLCFLFGFFTRKHKLPSNPKKILIIRDWSLGESLLALPVIRQIKEKFPQAQISVLVAPSSKPIFIGQPFVDQLIDFNPWNLLLFLFRRYDLAIDMMPYFRHSALIARLTSRYTIGFDTFKQRSKLYDRKIKFDDTIHMTHMLDRLFVWGKYKSQELIPLHSEPIRNKKLLALLKTRNPKLAIHLATATTAPWRAWDFDNFLLLISELLSRYPKLQIFLSGSPAEHEINKKMMRKIKNPHLINLEGKLNLYQLATLMTKLQCFISSDTGPMHIAASMSCPTIGLFGPNTPTRFGPFPLNKNFPIFKPEPNYQPSINVHKGEFGDKSEANTINRISVDDVLQKVSKLIK